MCLNLPKEHPANADFVDNLDRINHIAEQHPGFVWRLIGEGNDATDICAFDDPNIIVNMSVWSDLQSLWDFVYLDNDHTQFMRRRKEWFGKLNLHMALWWIEAGQIPSVAEAKLRLDLLRECGPSCAAFTFKHVYQMPVPADAG